MLSLVKGIVKRVKFSIGQMAQESGIALDQHGSRLTKDINYLEPLNRHRNVLNIYDSIAQLSESSYVSANCSIVGEVFLGDNSAVGYGSIIRGDHQAVRIGDNCSIQDQSVITNSYNLPVGVAMSTNIGHGVRVGVMSTITSAIIDDHVFIGHRVVVAEGAMLMRGCQLADATYVPPATQIPSAQLWAGSPAQYVRDLTAEEIKQNQVKTMEEIKQIQGHYTDFVTNPEKMLE